MDDLQAGREELVEERKEGCVRKRHEVRMGKRCHREKVSVEHREGTHQARREAEGEAEGRAVRERVRWDRERRSSARCEAAARLATRASTFAGAAAECSRER